MVDGAITDIDLTNAVVPFHVPALNVRGRFVRMNAVLSDILNRHDYPVGVKRLLGETTLLTGVLGSSLKFNGRFTVQFTGVGPVPMLVSDFKSPGQLRSCANVKSEEAVNLGPQLDTGVVGKGQLVLTIDQGANMNQYQGVVALDGGPVSAAAEVYFTQSEQLPTSVHLGAVEQMQGGNGEPSGWAGGGLLIQHLPAEGERMTHDLPGGDDPSGKGDDDAQEHDDWVTAKTLAGTVQIDELTDPTLSPLTVLYRLFNEFDVEIMDPIPLERFCQCSEQRCLGILEKFSATDLDDMVEDGKIEMACEFCNSKYAFTRKDDGVLPLKINTD